MLPPQLVTTLAFLVAGFEEFLEEISAIYLSCPFLYQVRT
jgi:hypothetical protein